VARYIDANLLLQQVAHINSTVEQGVKYFNSVYNLIQKQPIADVVEVVHGDWIGIDTDECSVCHRNIREIMDADSYYAIGFDVCDELLYCPFCGAKNKQEG
jgi:hypothetical protein